MNYFLDTEFIANGRHLDLISIAIVSEDNRELYCENAEADLSLADDWVKENVIPRLWRYSSESRAIANAWLRDGHGAGGLMTRAAIQNEIRLFCQDDAVFWAKNCAFDWVLLVQLFGTMNQLPEQWSSRWCRDLNSLEDLHADTLKPEQDTIEHFALNDARFDKQVYEYYVAIAREKLAV